MKRFALAVLLAGLGAGVLSAQQPAPSASEPPPVTFRAEVNYVEVDAFVTDQQGHLVTDLTQNDFEVLEDGKPQKISSFSLVNIPIEKAERPLFAGKPIEPDVQTNQHLDGRIYLIVLDDLHIDPTRAPRVKAAARRFIQQNFGVNDLAAVVYTGGRGNDSQDFTNDPQLQLKSIDRFTGRKLQSATIEQLDNPRTDPTSGQVGPGDDVDSQERAYRARSAMNTIRKLAEFMANVRGRRKAMLLISEGVDYNIFDIIGPNVEDIANSQTLPAPSAATSVLLDTRDAIAAATRGDVNIYAIDPRGLSTGAEDLITASDTFEDQGIGVSSLQSELRMSQDALRELADATGGFAAVNKNDLNGAFDRIVRENSTYYLLGYYPTNEKRDGKFRKVQVRLKRPGLTVRSRKGYVAPKGKPAATPPAPANALSPAVTEALGSPLPVSGLPMRVYASAFKGTPPNAAIPIAVELDVSRFNFVQQNGTYNDKLDIVYAATDSDGKIHPGDRNTLTLALKPETYQRVKANGLRVLTQANLPPGRYQIRVAAGDAGGAAGSVVDDLVVPDFSKEPLSMSGIALTSPSAAQVVTAAPKNPLKDFLPGPVTAIRDFPAGDTIVVFGEVYENVRGAAHMVDIKTELRDEGGQVIRNVDEQRSSAELEGKSGGYGFNAQLPLNGVMPGLYVIHVEAQSRAGSQPMVSRDVQIRVR
ncbi:MAG TPA: VWA domain-containing protein [Vicinamibacterales bacterium]|nr:VWA domain-containing protein [Vicinamibacterales bacterium]